MNIFELLGLLLWIGSGIAGALILHSHLGIIGIFAGFAFGVGLAYISYKVFFAVLDVWIPEFPSCQCGRNKGNRYKFQEWKTTEQGGSLGAFYTCNECGRCYLKTQRRLQEILKDDSLKSFMRHIPFGRWKRE